MPRKKKETEDKAEETNLPDKRSNYTGCAKIISETGKKYGLNEQQLRFAEMYLNDPQLAGNGVQCYVEAYRIKMTPVTYNSCRSQASRLLSQDNIMNYLQDRLNDEGLNDAYVDNNLKFLIKQNADLQAKAQGIKIYNDLRNRIEKKQTTAIQFNINIDKDNTIDIDHKEASKEQDKE